MKILGQNKRQKTTLALLACPPVATATTGQCSWFASVAFHPTAKAKSVFTHLFYKSKK